MALAAPARAMRIPECGEKAYVAKNATAIVEGRIAKVDSREEAQGNIVSYVQVRVSRYLKGKGPKVLTIKQLGGEIVRDGKTIGMGTSGDPSFKAGQRGYLYLEKPSDAWFEKRYYRPVCGWGVTAEPPAPRGKK